MGSPPLHIVLQSDFLYNAQGQHLGLVLGEAGFANKGSGLGKDVIFDELDKGVADVVVFEDHSAGQVEVENGQEGGVLKFEVHRLQDLSFGLFVFLLRA
jgi:hypothetical protein